MLISLTSSTSNSLQSVLGEFLTFSNYPCSLIYSVSSSALQTEALEEFLSILRPSFLRKPRSLTTKPRHRLDVTSDHYSLDSRDLTTPPDAQDIHPDARWFSSSLLCVYSIVSNFLYSHPMSLASPVSRMHTRNPFLRHSDDRSPVPCAPSAPLTPAAVPLPLPTPDELVDNNS